MRACFFPIIFALLLSVTFFGKGLIGVGVIIALFGGACVLFQERQTWAWGHIFCDKSVALITLIFGSWFLSCYFGLAPDKAIPEWMEHAGMTIGGILIFAALKKSIFSFDEFYRYCAIFVCVCAALSILHPFVRFMPESWGSNSFGSVLALLSPFLLYGLVTTRRPLYWVATIVMVIAIFALGGRTGWVTLMIASALFLVFFPWRIVAHAWVMKMAIIGMVVVGGFVGMILYKQSVDTVMYETRVTEVTMDRPASGRLDLWSESLALIDQNIWIGVGIKGFRELHLSKEILHAHNVILEIVIDTGFVGLLFLVLFVLYSVGRFTKFYWQTSDTKTCALMMPILISCVAYGTASMSLTSFFHAWWFLYFVVLLILLRLATDELKKSSTK